MDGESEVMDVLTGFEVALTIPFSKERNGGLGLRH
jgi:hypothetical protein